MIHQQKGYFVFAYMKMKPNLTVLFYLVFTLQPVTNGQPPAPGIDETDYLNFSVIVNPTIRLITQEFNLLCPHTALCSVNVYYNASLFQYIGEDLEVPCCGSCGCGADCLKTRDCCVDILSRLLTSEEIQAVYDDPTECVYTQFQPFDVHKYSGMAHTLITKCSESYAIADVIDKCLKPYSEFDLVVDIPEYLPVTDNRTMASYKNMYCALCNHVPRYDLIFWKADVVCNESIVLGDHERVKSLSEIGEFIKRDDRCNLIFNVPDYIQYREPFIESCIPYIDKCNVSGLWKQYDADLESLCMSYTSGYKGYKNVHCYICNGFDTSTISEICLEGSPAYWPSSFVSLLDFNNLELSEEEGKNRNPKPQACEEGQNYDFWAETCRYLACPEFMIYKHMKCQPVFDEATFDITVRLVPIKESTDVRIIPALQDLIAFDVSRRVFTINASNSSKVFPCNIQMFVKLKETLTDHERRNQQTPFSDISFEQKVSHIALRLIITATEVQNVQTFIEELTDQLYGLDFDQIGLFKSDFIDINFGIFESQLRFPKDTEGDKHPNYYEHFRFNAAYADPTDGLTILPVVPFTQNVCPESFRLFPFSFCPLIKLPELEFLVAGKLIYLKHKGVYINSSAVVFSENGSTITLCSDAYFSDDNTISRNMPEQNPYEAEFIVSVICTCISLFSLFLVFVTYCCFKVLRTLPGLNTMSLTLFLFFAQLFYILGGTVEIKEVWLCEVIGLLLHLCLDASFFWMGICTFHMMMVFVFISRRSGSENTKIAFSRYVFIVTVAAVIMVCINVIVSLTSDTDSSRYGYGGQPCYIADKHMILYTVAIPLGVVIISNFIMFLYVIFKVSRLPDVKKNTKHERRNIIIFAKLSTLTGLTWVFAYVYQWTGVKAFAYLFIVANATQGVFIMFSFIINKRVYEMLKTAYKSSAIYKTSFSKTYTTSDRTASQNTTGKHK